VDDGEQRPVLATSLIRPELIGKRGLSCYFTLCWLLGSSARICVVNNNFKKRYDLKLSFPHILQKPKYKKPTFKGRFFVVTC
jgi:hypothetical protein